LMFIYPGAMAFFTFLLMFFCYKLTDRKFKEIVAELGGRE